MKNEVLEKCKSNLITDVETLLKFSKPSVIKVRFGDVDYTVVKDDKEMLKKYFTNESGYQCAYANLLHFKEAALNGDIKFEDIKKEVENDFKKFYVSSDDTFTKFSLNFRGWKYNPDHYRFRTCEVQDEWEEDLFKYENSNEEAEKSLVYTKLDMQAVDTLSKILYKAIKARLIILLNLEDIPSLLNTAYKCDDNDCSYINKVLNDKIVEIRNLFENKEVSDFIKSGVTDMSLYNSAYCVSDYIETYQKVLRQLTDIRDDRLDYMKDIAHNELDLLEDEILANDSVDFESYFEDSESEDSECEEDEYALF